MILKNKWMVLTVGIALLLIVIGVYGAVNSFFVNENVYFTSLVLILLGVGFLFYVVINYLIRKFESLNTLRKSLMIFLIILLIILSTFFITEIL